MSRHVTARRRWPTAVSAFVVPAALLGLALAYPGAPVQQVDLDDGAVWVTQGGRQVLGRWNAAIEELNAGVAATSPALDVLQDAGSVVLTEPGRVAVVDPASVAVVHDASVPSGALVDAARGTVAVLDQGRLHVSPLDGLRSVEAGAADGVDLGPGSRVVVSRASGTAFGLRSDGTLVAVRPDGSSREAGRLAGELRASDAVTGVGDDVVALVGTTLHTPWTTVDLAGRGDLLVLQQPGPAARSVLVATPDALLAIGLEDGSVTEYPSGGSATPAAPVRVGSCAHAAWASTVHNYVGVCGGETTTRDLAEVSPTSRLVFRVNRDVVVLNDLEDGRLWAPGQDAAVRVPDWSDVVPQEQQQEGDQSSQDSSTQTVQAACTEQTQDPSAVDDEFGVRPGRTTILPVLDNDIASDCGVLVINSLDGLPPEFGTITPVFGGRALQLVTAPGATGVVSLTYTVVDGRGNKPATAAVRLVVRSPQENGAPAQLHVGQVEVELGASATYDVAPDFRDPDGDQLVLLAAETTGGGTVRVRQDGRLTFLSDGTTLGRQTVTLTVSDGALTATGTLVVDVRPAGSLVPTVDPVHAVTYVGQPVTVHPLTAVRSGSREPARLAGVSDVTGATVTSDLGAGTFTFTAARPGAYYVTFVVTAAPQQATGVARIDVAEQPETPAAPVAVLDVALLPADGEVVIDPLANDVDPAGGVLVLQSVQVPDGSGLEVAVLGHQLVRISSTRALDQSVSVPYTISNGVGSATGEIRVKPIAATGGQQPPVVAAVNATVRAGGVVTIPVLDSAFDPDGDPLTLGAGLGRLGPDDGLLFPSGDVLRYQAPNVPTTVRTTFEVVDSHGNATQGQLTVTVHASDPAAKSPPRPRDLTARVFEGETIRIPVPITGIDVDGDGVLLLGEATAPTKGRIVAHGADWLEYEALPGELGTDTFTYAVEDWVGQRAVATIRVGIAERPTTSAQVVARNDQVTVRPGRTVSVRVLANDVDMSGGDLSLAPELEAPAGVQVSIENQRRIVVEAPSAPGTLQIAYTARNTRGGQDSAVLTVVVSADAPILPPVARDVVVPAAETLNALSVEVNVLEVAENPSGPLSDLAVSVHPSAADVAHVTDRGTIVVTLGASPRTLPYVLTNTAADAGGAQAYAFITVPALGDFPPVRRPNAPALEVVGGTALTIDLAEQVQVAPGRTPRVADPSAVTATKSDGTPLVVDAGRLTFRAPKTYSGPASITLEVSDGPSGDPTARRAVITLPITVFAFEDHPPRFQPSVLDVGPGDQLKVDLSAFVVPPVSSTSTDPATYRYEITTPVPAGFTASLDRSVFTLGAASTTARGTAGSIGVSIDYGGLQPLDVQVDFRVVASQRPLARVLDHTVPTGVSGATSTVSVLTGAYNPYPSDPLTVVGASVESGTGTVAFTASSVSVTPAAGFVGPMVVRYRVADVTGDGDRQVDGRVTVVVRSVPGTPAAPRVTQVADKAVTLAWDAPVANGEPITSYRVTATPGGVVTECPTATCTITGLTNDTEYTFTVVARNAVGDSLASPPSGPARPDVRPAAPGAPSVTWGDGQLAVSWTAPANPGSPIKDYQLELSPAPTSGSAVVTTSSTSYTFGNVVNGTAYSVRVRATNAAPDPGDWSGWSAPQTPAGVPGLPGSVAATRAQVGGGAQQITVTWTASAPNGDAVSRYDVRVNGTVIARPGTDTSYAFDAERGVAYTIEVRAANKAGVTSWVSTTGEIWSSPGPVGGLTAVDAGGPGTAYTDGALLVTWSPPADTGGVPLTGYLLSVDGGAPVSVGGTSYRAGGLAGGAHSVTVVAVNSKGAESAPATTSGTAETAPQSPTLGPPDLSVDGYVTVGWTPGATGGSAIIDYRYVVTIDGVAQPDGTTAAAGVTVGPYPPGAQLSIQVWARNAVGESWASDPLTVTVPGTPAPPPAPPDPGGTGG